MPRPLRITLLTLVLAALIWYGHSANPAVTLRDCLADPERYEGRRITLATEVTVVQTWPDSLIVHQAGLKVKVIGPPGNVRPGEYVSLIARFRSPGRLELEALHPARGRRAKIVWSILPLLLLAFFWLAAYRFDCRRFNWEERQRCRTS